MEKTMRQADFDTPHIFDLVTKALKFYRAATNLWVVNIVNVNAAKCFGPNCPSIRYLKLL